jgi:hypothetical protein
VPSNTLTTSLLLAAVVLTGCERTPASDVAAPVPSSTNRADVVADDPAAGEEGVEQSVTGHYEYGGFVTGNYFKYSVSAIRHADGSVSGEVEEHLTDIATGDFVRRSHGTVTCMNVTGNRARIGFVLDSYEGTPVLPEGVDHGIISVVDNGEGGNAIPDSASNNPGGVTAAQAQGFCDRGAVRPLREVEHGNIQVRP